MKRLSKKAKKPVQDNYNGIPIADLWDMDMTLTRLIANHLHAFLKAQKSDMVGIPGIIVDKVGEEKARAAWLNIIRKMIYAFDMYQRPLHQDEETKSRIREGMQLFVDYFMYLWI